MQIQDMRHACIAGYHTKYTRNSVYMHVDRHGGGTALQKKLSALDMNAEMNASLSTIKKTLLDTDRQLSVYLPPHGA